MRNQRPQNAERAKNINIQEHGKPSASCKYCLHFPGIINKHGLLLPQLSLQTSCLKSTLQGPPWWRSG